MLGLSFDFGLCVGYLGRAFVNGAKKDTENLMSGIFYVDYDFSKILLK